MALTTGLLTRWRLYYEPLSTLIRLLALQGICWPATQLTITILEHDKRPAVVWALIGTTTCMSRSAQIWVTSNLWWDKREGPSRTSSSGAMDRILNPTLSSLTSVTAMNVEGPRRTYLKRLGGGKWGGRRWDWREVGLKCVLPAGIVYFVMAWAEMLRREWETTGC